MNAHQVSPSCFDVFAIRRVAYISTQDRKRISDISKVNENKMGLLYQNWREAIRREKWVKSFKANYFLLFVE